MKKIFIYSVLFALIMISCDKEDFTGYSTIVPTTPTISVTGIPASINFIEKDSIFTFNVTMSVAQVVDVVLVAKQIGGTAKEGDDFKIMNDAGKLTILAGATTGQFKIKILADDVKEVTETATIQIGDETTANASLTPVNVVFTIQNSSTDELSVDMSWDTDVLEAVGVDLPPTDVADLRLLIVDSNGDIVDAADGGSFETWADFNALPDGVYKVAADIYATMDFGDINAPVTLSLSLEFNQPGVINNETMDFPDVMTNENPCEAYRTYLATVTKTGTSYTIEKKVSYMVPEKIKWYGEDATYPSQILTTAGCELQMDSVLGGWMLDWWGEIIIDGAKLVYTDDGDGNIDIPFQYYCTTTYKGVAQTPYYIQGSGTIDNTGAFPVMTLHYDINQGGTWIGNYSFINYGWVTDGFDAVITTDPAAGGKKGNVSVRPSRPVR